jgi:hypothetical protein
MAGYLDHYGEGDERREKMFRLAWKALAGLAVLAFFGSIFWFYFKNHSQENEVSNFLALLEKQDYKGAYALWGCTDAQPCRGYTFADFLKDWGPDQFHAGGYEVRDGESCGSGVIVDVHTPNSGEKKLWVERGTMTMGYPPFDECPQRNRIGDFLRGLKYKFHGWTQQ